MLLFWYYCPTQIVPYTLVHKIKEKKREKKQKKNIWQWFVKGCFFMRCFTHFRSWKAWQFVSEAGVVIFKKFVESPNRKRKHKCQQLYRKQGEIIYTFIFKCEAAQIKIKFQWKSKHLKITKKSLILCFVIQIE